MKTFKIDSLKIILGICLMALALVLFTGNTKAQSAKTEAVQSTDYAFEEADKNPDKEARTIIVSETILATYKISVDELEQDISNMQASKVIMEAQIVDLDAKIAARLAEIDTIKTALGI